MDNGWHKLFLPHITAANKPFWDNLKSGVFSTTQCKDCHKVTFPPQAMCPYCFSTAVAWVELSGKGTVYTFTQNRVVPPAYIKQAPYVTAMIDIEEGPRLLARIKNATYEEVKIGQKVQVGFEPLTSEITTYYFSPIDKEQ
ncbi:MAG: Zn-ribbon domain-containing OB-fold protein [Thermodesulfobacteriota bacterium]